MKSQIQGRSMVEMQFSPSDKVRITLVMLAFLFFAGCAGTKQASVDKSEPEYATVTVNVPQENLRSGPNSSKVGETFKGSQFLLKQRRANWCQVSSDSTGDVWIWAPSLGLKSVNVLTLAEWIGTRKQPRSVDQVTDLFGPPTEVLQVASQAVMYRYQNAGELFGTRQLRDVMVWVDRATRTVVRVEFELPPFEGRRMELLGQMGLPKVKASSTDFTESIYENKFDGIGFLTMTFGNGSFEVIERVNAELYSPNLLENDIVIPEKKVTIEGEYLTLELTMRNQSAKVAYSCPLVELELVEGSKNLGTWTLGPGDVRIEPGTESTFRMPIPLKAASVNVKQVGARAELVEMLAVPANAGMLP